MQRPALPDNEADRLRSLAEYEILDTEAEPSFDALTRLVAHVLEVPVALVSLVDADRQWFKSRFGLATTETPRDVSFCGHVVASGEPLLVPDTHKDVRFFDNPLVTGDPWIGFYLAVPLRTSEGHVLGTLCAIDRRPREIRPAQGEMLELLAMQTMAQLDLRRQNRALAAQRAEAETFRRFFELSPDLLCTARGDMQFQYLSPAWEATLGWTPAELRSRPALSFLHPDDVAQVMKLNPGSAVVEPGVLRMDARVLHRSGTWVPIAWTSVEADGMFYASGRDITELVQADRLKRELISTVSHELRTPLTSIRGALGLVAAGVTGELPDAAREYVGIALTSCERLGRLVNDMLDLDRMAAGQLDLRLRAVDLGQVALRAITLSEPRASALGLRLVFSVGQGDLRARADEDRVAQVLENLLSNAIKFSTAGTQVSVRVTRVGGRVRAEVRDRGPGVDPDFRSRIFQRFAQADGSDARASGGSGLGLAICKALVEAMSGVIGFEDAPGGGALFYFELPEGVPDEGAADRR